MAGRVIDFDTMGSLAQGYLATPDVSAGAQTTQAPGVIVLHAWWGLTEPFRQACDRLAEAGFVALAPDLYHGKTTTSIEEAETLAQGLDDQQANGDIAGAMRYLRQHAAPDATASADDSGKLALVGFSMGGAYALVTSINRAEEVAAVVTFYTTVTGLDYSNAQAAYLCHFAEHDAFDPPEAVAEMEQEMRSAGKPTTFYTYPGTEHWFVEANRPDVYNAEAAKLAWERTIAFLKAELSR